MKNTLLTISLLSALSLLPLHAQADGDPNEAPAASSSSSEAPATPPSASGCEFSHLIGKKDTEIDRTQFGDRVVRSLKPGQMVTMEYLEGRVNLQVDDAGVIIGVTCG